MNNIILKTERLTKEFKTGFKKRVKVVSGLNLELESGEIFGFLGPNGAGKTTTIKLILGLIYPTSGRIWLFGEKAYNVDLKNKIGFLPEHPYFYDYLTAYEILDFYGQLFNIDKKERIRKITELLEMVGLEDYKNVQLRKFSKGMVQKIGIAQALINDPQLLILDEPLSGLDPIGRKEVRDIILNLKASGRTVFFSSHILADVEMICDRVGILVKGELKDIGRLGDLLSPEVKSYEVTAQGVNEQGKKQLLELSTTFIERTGKIFFTLKKADDIDKIIEIIKINQGHLLSLVPHKEALEEVFIQKLGGV